GFSQDSLQWVITAYSIMFGGFLLLGGRLADLLGRRRLFVAGLALFTVSSLLDGFAWSEGSLIAFRSLQGLRAPAAPAAGVRDPAPPFHRGPGAQPRPRGGGRRVGERGRGGRAARRRAHKRPLVVVFLFHHRPRGRPGEGAAAFPAPGGRGRPAAPPLR